MKIDKKRSVWDKAFVCSKTNSCPYPEVDCNHRLPHKQLLYYGYAAACAGSPDKENSSCGECIPMTEWLRQSLGTDVAIKL